MGVGGVIDTSLSASLVDGVKYLCSEAATTMRMPEDNSNPDKSKTAWPVSRFKSVDLPDEMTNQADKPTGAFQRVVYVGSFEVTENIVQSDVPPGNIRFFKAVKIRPGANDTLEVQFSWTWPGAHMTIGNASAVDIRASKDEAKLYKEFEKQKRMTAADVVEGSKCIRNKSDVPRVVCLDEEFAGRLYRFIDGVCPLKASHRFAT
ncbi:hypothetical protein HPB51_028910 [Rhipicephalus microplus]|uniref:Uncharacterized protein n=1 Tax=Rhipicephalus microplus TaxID=6941 RepID=A0A9J6CW19_RHIMP|nr:hypothetical protein HPB51_028910 [Rhipicephalus microplus]